MSSQKLYGFLVVVCASSEDEMHITVIFQIVIHFYPSRSNILNTEVAQSEGIASGSLDVHKSL